LQVEKAAIDGERKAVEADLGPVRYLSQLVGASDERVRRWFILAVALLLDPAAVVLLLAATARRTFVAVHCNEKPKCRTRRESLMCVSDG